MRDLCLPRFAGLERVQLLPSRLLLQCYIHHSLRPELLLSLCFDGCDRMPSRHLQQGNELLINR
jgi:hypothetical protein